MKNGGTPKNYRGKYSIAVYSLISEGETLLALCDNYKEFAEFLGTTERSALMILNHLFKGRNKYLRLNGKLRTVEFIEL